MTFLTYRTMVYSFQDNIIPVITEEMIPYFQKVEDNIRVNELSTNLQTSVIVSDENKNKDIKALLFTHDQIKFTELVLSILR